MENRKKAPEGFYSAKEAREIIGVPPSSFYHLVKKGIVKGTVLPGRKEAVYPKREIEKYARAIQAHIEQFTDETYSFGVALKEDLPDIHDLIQKYGSGLARPLPETILEAWLRKNPESVYVLRQGGKIVGYTSILPLPLETIERRMKKELSHRTIPIDDIEPYTSDKPLRLYIADVIVNLSENQHARLGARLILEIIRFLHRLAKEGIEVTEIYTVATSKFGLRLCESIHMEQLPPPALTTENRVPFRLDVATSTNPQVIEYRRVLHATQLALKPEP